MKKLKLTVLSTACVLALTACGGGGSDEPVITTTVPSTNTTATTTTTTGTATTTTGTTTSTTAAATTATATTTTATKPATTTTTTAATPAANTAATFSDAMKKGLVSMKEGTFNGAMVSIDKNGKATGAQTANANFEQFRVGSTKILLLQNVNDKLGSVPVRKLTEKDFPNGGFGKGGFVGSTYGAQNDPEFVGNGLQSFGRVRFGVYTDADNTSHLFIHGNPSTRIFAGTYHGSAIIGKEGNYTALPKAVTATVDSALTKVDVSIKTDKTTLNFGGAIDNNAKTFAGSKGGVETRGGFFGKDGLAGIFSVTDGAHKGEQGVFGASNGKDVADDYK